MLALSNSHGMRATALYHRYYRSYIRAFNDAKDASRPRPNHPEDDDYVTEPEFRFLLAYLGIYATWLEVFAHLIDTGAAKPPARRDALDMLAIETDHRIVREEWDAAIERVRKAGHTWAPYIRLRNVSMGDFDQIDSNGGGYIDFRETPIIPSLKALLVLPCRPRVISHSFRFSTTSTCVAVPPAPALGCCPFPASLRVSYGIRSLTTHALRRRILQLDRGRGESTTNSSRHPPRRERAAQA